MTVVYFLVASMVMIGSAVFGYGLKSAFAGDMQSLTGIGIAVMVYGAASNILGSPRCGRQRAKASRLFTAACFCVGGACLIIGGTWMVCHSAVVSGALYIIGGFALSVSAQGYLHRRTGEEAAGGQDGQEK